MIGAAVGSQSNVPATPPEPSRVDQELRILQRACEVHRWRWRANIKRLRRRPGTGPWELHLEEIRTLNRVWFELRREAGMGRGLPLRARKAADRILRDKFRAVLAKSGHRG
jgi:hypothetical protein